MPTVDFATFCYRGDAPRLHAPGQLKKQVESNNYSFNKVFVIHQLCNPFQFENSMFDDCYHLPIELWTIDNLDEAIKRLGIDLDRPQYVSPTDKAHSWKYHVANHAIAIVRSTADYIVFADADCWMIRQPTGESWVKHGIDILEMRPDVFIVSPNDGEPERKTQIISQQMFLTRVADFKQADFNQPGWDGDVTKHPEMPEYHAMLEGRIHHYCKATGRYRYVLGPEYRYIHHNKFNEDGTFYTNYKEWLGIN